MKERGVNLAGVIHRRDNCRGCGNHHLKLVFSLRPSPIGDAYVTKDKLKEPQPSYPIDLYMCSNCGLAQILDVIDPKILYGEYIYLTASSHGLSEHFRDYADSVAKLCRLETGSLVIDIGSNDGTLLRNFQQRGMKVLGIEPASHIAEIANIGGIRTVNGFFTPDLAKQILDEYGYPQLITANNVFANVDDLVSWVNGINLLLSGDGVFVFESYYLADLVQNMVFDFIYHEHLSAFSVKPVLALFDQVGLEVAAIRRVDTKGGSLRYFIQRRGGPLAKDTSVVEMLAEEERIGLYRVETYRAFTDKINRQKKRMINFLAQAKRDGKSVAGFGASITGTTLIYHFEIGHYLDYLIDDNAAKQGRFSPGLHLPVYPTTILRERKPDYLIALAWRFVKPFLAKNQSYIEAGGSLIIPVPQFKIVKKHQAKSTQK
jgi:hypothetical protein